MFVFRDIAVFVLAYLGLLWWCVRPKPGLDVAVFTKAFVVTTGILWVAMWVFVKYMSQANRRLGCLMLAVAFILVLLLFALLF